MSKLTQLLYKKIIVLVLCALAGTFNCAKASVNEDSCRAFMNITPDHFDPLLMHFEFTGTVPISSFQFLGVWDFGDGITSNDSCPSHLYSQPGTYVVCLSFSICIGGGLSCHDDTCETITIGSIAGIDNPGASLTTFYAYPNPVQSKLYIRSDAAGDVSLKIKDLTGQVVFSGNTMNDAPVDVSSFSKGIYFIEVSDGMRTIERKMVVQH